MEQNNGGMRWSDGLIWKNPLLVSGMVIAPAVAAAFTVSNALVIIFVFSCVTFLTVLLASFVPRTVAYAIRIILYTLIAAVVYMPVVIAAEAVFGAQVQAVGIFVPLLIANGLIVSKTETRFFRQPKLYMITDVLLYVAGYDIALLIFSFFREILATGGLGQKILGIPMVFSGLSQPYGGFILLGLTAALFRKILTAVSAAKGGERK